MKMDREIKFRAWNKNRKMITGNHPIWEWGGASRIEKRNLILMQYTGLKDKSGNEIYEGDILQYFVYAPGMKHEQLEDQTNLIQGVVTLAI